MAGAGGIGFSNGLKAEVVAPGARIMRIHQLTDGPIWFSPAVGQPPRGRFDAPGGQYRTLYAAATLAGAFCETILHTPVGHIVRREFVERRAASTFVVQRSLKLAMLHSEGLLFHGVDAQISSGPYAPCRALALAFHQTFSDLDGLAYRSRHNNAELCVALYDRVAAADLALDSTRPLADLSIEVDDLMRRHGAVFDTSPSIPTKLP